MSVRVLIVDDERPARSKLRSHFARAALAEVVGEAADGEAAVRAIEALAPDVVFLDVRMPGLDGFEVIDAVGSERMPVVVFVTAYDRYALDAFEVEAVDYLLKPYDEQRFQRAWRRACESFDRGGGAARLTRLLEGLPRHGRFLERLVARDGERITLVPVTRVRRLSADGNYIELDTDDGRARVRGTLNRLESRLDPARFARIHRSTLVNLDRVRELTPWSHGDYVVVLDAGSRSRLSRRYRHRLLGDPEESR
jgi:two-component system LytT family response regulator